MLELVIFPTGGLFPGHLLSNVEGSRDVHAPLYFRELARASTTTTATTTLRFVQVTQLVELGNGILGRNLTGVIVILSAQVVADPCEMPSHLVEHSFPSSKRFLPHLRLRS